MSSILTIFGLKVPRGEIFHPPKFFDIRTYILGFIAILNFQHCRVYRIFERLYLSFQQSYKAVLGLIFQHLKSSFWKKYNYTSRIFPYIFFSKRGAILGTPVPQYGEILKKSIFFRNSFKCCSRFKNKKYGYRPSLRQKKLMKNAIFPIFGQI